MTTFTTWAEREGLRYEAGRLICCGHDVGSFAAAFDEPVYFYDGDRAIANLRRVGTALTRHSIKHRVYYAMKANRFRPLLVHMRTHGLFGLDVCSGEEIRDALACGFAPEHLSFTAHGLSLRDARLLSHFPGIIVNLDTISAIHSFGRLMPGRSIGLRINPKVGVGYRNNERLCYSGDGVTKFGIYREQLEQAIAAARKYDLTISTLHCHAGVGLLMQQLDSYRRVLQAVRECMESLPDLKLVNLGGGLGVCHRPDDVALDLDEWSGLIADTVGLSGVEIAVEPGDYVVKDAGMLVLRANYCEEKEGVLFVGLDGGFNLAMGPAFYDLPCVPVPCAPRPGPLRTVTVAGNINEALDIWAKNIELPPIQEGDLVALLNTGGYSASMSSNHCLNGRFREFLLVGNQEDADRTG